MLEFGILCVVWLAFLAWASRKGTKHLTAKHVGVTLPLAGGVCAALLEALPTTAITPGFTFRTVIAVLAGVFAGRMFGRGATLWAAGHERRAVGNPNAPTPRIMHPLIAVGLFVAGVPALWHLLTSNYALIEELTTPRDEKTGVVHGSEEVRVETGAPAAVLLIHGLYGSPSDFTDLPKAIAAKGLDVHAPLLPGHGRTPDALDAVWADEYRKAVRVAYDELAAKHARVAVVGGSMGAALALPLAAEKKPAALVLVNPYLGRLATPAWCPVAADSLVGPLSRVCRRLFVDQDMRGFRYSSQSLHALRQCRDLARGVDAAAKDVACPTLVAFGRLDVVVPADFTASWTSTNLPRAETTAYDASGHDLFRDVDGRAATQAVAEFLAKNVPR